MNKIKLLTVVFLLLALTGFSQHSTEYTISNNFAYPTGRSFLINYVKIQDLNSGFEEVFEVKLVFIRGGDEVSICSMNEKACNVFEVFQSITSESIETIRFKDKEYTMVIEDLKATLVSDCITVTYSYYPPN